MTQVVIGALGSSVGNGPTLPDPATQAPVGRLVALLNARSLIDFEADNRSVDGSVIFAYATPLALLTDPDTKAVLICYGMNDGLAAHYNFGQTFTLATSRTEAIIDAIRALDMDPILVTTPHPHPSRITVEAPSTDAPMNYPVLTWRRTESYTFGVNLATDDDFESSIGVWGKGGSNTLAISSEQAKWGTKSGKATYQDDSNLASRGHNGLSAGTYSASIWVYVPTAYDGAFVRFQRLGDWTGATGDILTDANLALRDQWQRLTLTFAHTGTSGSLSVQAPTAPSAARFVYIDGHELSLSASAKRITATTVGGFNTGSGITGLQADKGIYVSSGSNQGLYTIDAIDASGDFLSVDEVLPQATAYSVEIHRANLQPEELIPSASTSFPTQSWNGSPSVQGSYRHGAINQMFRDVAEDKGVLLLDAERYWMGAVASSGYDALYDLGESVHPNLAGHQASYWAVLSQLAESLFLPPATQRLEADYVPYRRLRGDA